MYDFETILNRRGTGSYKWDAIEKEMGAGREDVIPMSVADMEFKAAPEIIRAVVKSAEYGVYGYTGPNRSYYDAVVGWMKKRHRWEIDPHWISLSPGVVPGIFTAVRAFTHPGDQVIIQQPVYYPFANAAVLNGCTVVNNALLKKNGRYTMNFEDLEKKAGNPRAKVLILCNPHNPVGRVWTADELKTVGEICLRNHVVVISDEIHFDFIFRPFVHTVFAAVSEECAQNCLIMTAPSKTFNLAGLQTSNIIIPNPELRAAFNLAAENTGNFSLNYFGYAACEAAYRFGEAWLNELMLHLEENKKILSRFVKENLPQIQLFDLEGTYLAWMDFNSLKMNPEQLERFMKEKARVFFDEGYLFGAEGSGFERINLACPRKMLETVLGRLETAISSLSGVR